MPVQRSMTRLRCLALLSCVALAGGLPAAAQNVTPTPETGVTPSTLLLYRADLISGKETAYEQTESDIVRSYADAKIPIYWSALEAVTGSPHVLYFNGCNKSWRTWLVQRGRCWLFGAMIWDTA